MQLNLADRHHFVPHTHTHTHSRHLGTHTHTGVEDSSFVVCCTSLYSISNTLSFTRLALPRLVNLIDFLRGRTRRINISRIRSVRRWLNTENTHTHTHTLRHTQTERRIYYIHCWPDRTREKCWATDMLMRRSPEWNCCHEMSQRATFARMAQEPRSCQEAKGCLMLCCSVLCALCSVLSTLCWPLLSGRSCSLLLSLSHHLSSCQRRNHMLMRKILA